MLKRVLTKGEEQIRLILNRYDPDDSISPADVEKSLGLKVYWKIRNDYEAVMGSVNSGKPIVLNGGSAYTHDVKALAAQLTGVPLHTKGSRGGIMRLLGTPFRAIRRKSGESEGKGE
jgi:Flp pilus assembly CpaE family ATPase